jgi:hypothetical protein
VLRLTRTNYSRLSERQNKRPPAKQPQCKLSMPDA